MILNDSLFTVKFEGLLVRFKDNLSRSGFILSTIRVESEHIASKPY